MLAKQFSDIIKQNRHETAEDPLRRFDPPATFTSDKGKEPHSAPVAPDETSGSPLTQEKTMDGELAAVAASGATELVVLMVTDS